LADAIFFVLRTGCQWRALDQTELCAHSTAHDRFQAWVKAGVFLKLWQAGVKRFDELCGTLVGVVGDGRSDDQSAAGREKNRQGNSVILTTMLYS
jgi:transposase